MDKKPNKFNLEEFKETMDDLLQKRAIDAYWNENAVPFFQEGAVFKLYGTSKLYDGIYETVRIYSKKHLIYPPLNLIIARKQNTNNFQSFVDYSIGKECKLMLMKNIKPMYQTKETRGIIKFDEEMEKRTNAPIHHDRYSPPWVPNSIWSEFSDFGYVFEHLGFNETFETFNCHNLPDLPRTEENNVIIARSYDRPVFVEFTLKDFASIKKSNLFARYTRWGSIEDGCGGYISECKIPALNLDN